MIPKLHHPKSAFYFIYCTQLSNPIRIVSTLFSHSYKTFFFSFKNSLPFAHLTLISNHFFLFFPSADAGNIELLSCICYLDLRQSFSRFDITKLRRLAELYPEDFSLFDLMTLTDQLDIYIYDVRQSVDFVGLVGIGQLAKKLVETEKHTIYPLVYRLIELALVLPVATASVERAFSAMNIIKTDLRNKMGDEFLSDSLVCYIERDIFVGIDNKSILQRFQNMQTRRMQLPVDRSK